MYEDYQPQSAQRAQRELMASAVFSVTSVAIHPYENRCKNPVDSAVRDRIFNIVKGQIVICHLLEKVRDDKLVFLIPYLLTDEPDDFCMLGHLNLLP
jgi:hypothetical protein